MNNWGSWENRENRDEKRFSVIQLLNYSVI